MLLGVETSDDTIEGTFTWSSVVTSSFFDSAMQRGKSCHAGEA